VASLGCTFGVPLVPLAMAGTTSAAPLFLCSWQSKLPDLFCIDTVDGCNPAPPRMMIIPFIL